MKRFHLTIFLSLAFIMAAMAQPPLSLSVGSPTCSSSISLIGQFQNAGQTGAWRVDITPQYSSDGSSWTSLTLKSIYAGGTTSQSWTFNSYGFFYFRWQVAYYFNYGAGYTYWGGATYNNNQTSGVYYAASANFNVNSVAVSPTSPYEGYGFNCPDNALTLNNTAAGNMNNPQYQLYYQEATSTGTPTGSPYGFSTWQSGWPAASYDLKNWPSTVMGASANVGKYYLITMKVKNGCNGSESVKQGLVHINGAPSVPNSALTISNPVTGIPCFSDNPSSPCTMCTGSATMNISNSTGFIFYYRKFVERNISGTWTTVYDSGNQATFTGVSGLTSLYITYNGFTWVNGGQYRVTLTVGNQCGHDEAVSYFTVASCKTDDVALDVKDTDEGFAALNVYPNPTTGNVIVYSSLKDAETVSMELYNHIGSRVAVLQNNVALQAGDNFTELELSNYASGVYVIVATNAAGQRKSVKIIKQ